MLSGLKRRLLSKRRRALSQSPSAIAVFAISMHLWRPAQDLRWGRSALEREWVGGSHLSASPWFMPPSATSLSSMFYLQVATIYRGRGRRGDMPPLIHVAITF